MDMTLKPLALFPFTSKEIKPRGWMRRQLEIQAAGLAGNLDKIWPDVADSSWIGGSHDSWERVPYWLDGFIPLAYLLDDEDLKARAKKYIDAILARQEPDGWLCPCERKERSRYDTWALELISKVLVLWYDCSGDERIPNALYRAMKQFDRHTDRHLVLDWGSTRWFEVLSALYRLYEWYGEEWILSLADKMGAIGVDWKRVFTRWQYEKPRYGDRATWGQLHHVVNNEMMLKSAALYSRVSGEDPTAFFEEVWGKLSAAHGQPYGVFSGDECLAGTSPIAGTELCSVVEAMFSFETRVTPPLPTKPNLRASMPCRRPCRPICGRISMCRWQIRLPAASSRRKPCTSPPTRARRTCTGWSRTTAAAPPIWVRVSPNCAFPRSSGKATALPAPCWCLPNCTRRSTARTYA